MRCAGPEYRCNPSARPSRSSAKRSGKRITYGDDGWAERLRLPAYTKGEVTVDPRQAFGQPIVEHGGARVEDLVDRFEAGDGFTDIAG